MARVFEKIQRVIAGLRRPSRPRGRPARTNAINSLQALAVISEGPDREALQRAFRDAQWRLEFANDCMLAIDRQHEEPIPIVLYERELAVGDWRHAVSSFSHLTPRPCVILLSRNADQNLWDELVRCGGFELLRIPIDPAAVVQTVNAGWAIWRRKAAADQHQEMTPFRTA